VKITAGWYGMRPMTPDGLPIVGSAGVDGLFVHGGHGSIGMQSAPGTARMLAEIMAGQSVSGADRFAMTRFSKP
jgi:glycine/D-amino acid oxidase-like deaminating enzyme